MMYWYRACCLLAVSLGLLASAGEARQAKPAPPLPVVKKFAIADSPIQFSQPVRRG